MRHYDVVVVGGRIAGASTALLLARAGVRVVLVEHGRRGSDTISTLALMRGGLLQLSRWGVLPEVVAANTPPVHEVVFHYADGEDVSVPIRPSTGVDALYAPRRYLLDRLLVDAAASAGAEVLHQASATALIRDGEDRVTGVQVRGPRGVPISLHAPLTIGADGVRSTVAAAVQAPVVWRGANATGVLYRYFSDLPASGYEWAYGEGAAAGLIPTNDGTCVFVGATSGQVRSLRRNGAEQAFATLLAMAAPAFIDRVAEAKPATGLRGWGGIPGYLRRCWGNGWALVGDAGYFKDPITSHGMTDALRDAELLANAVLAALSGCDEASALEAYERTRDLLSRDMFDATEAVAAYDWNLDKVRYLLREVSSAMGAEVDHLQSLQRDS